MAKILIADDQDMMRDSLAATLARDGHEIIAATDGPTAVTRLSSGALRSADQRSEDAEDDRHRAVERIRTSSGMPVVLMTAFATMKTAVEAMKLVAYDYIQKPFDGEESRCSSSVRSNTTGLYGKTWRRGAWPRSARRARFRYSVDVRSPPARSNRSRKAMPRC